MEGGLCGVVRGENGWIWWVWKMGCARASVSAGLGGFCWLGRYGREIGRVYVVRCLEWEY